MVCGHVCCSCLRAPVAMRHRARGAWLHRARGVHKGLTAAAARPSHKLQVYRLWGIGVGRDPPETWFTRFLEGQVRKVR